MTAPLFTVVVPTHRRPDDLAGCLDALCRMTAPGRGFETIVVEDGGDGYADEIAGRFRNRLDVTVLRRPRGGPAAARNTGAEAAGGRYLAFTDDDCRPAPEWLDRLAARLAGAPDAAVGGRTFNLLVDNACSAASQTIVDMLYAHYNAVPDEAAFFAANNLAVPAAGFRELGGFDPSFRTAEDRDLCDRWLHDGRRMVYAPDARVFHARTLDVRGFARQHFDYGRGAVRFHRRRRERGSGSFFATLRFHLQLPQLARRSLADASHRAGSLAGLMLLWQIANAAGFAWEAVSARPSGRSLASPG